MHPSSSDDLRADNGGAVFDVDSDDHHDHTLFGQNSPVAQYSRTDITDDAVDIEIARWHLSGGTKTRVVKGDLIAIGTHDDLRGSNTHLTRQLRMRHKMSIFTVNRNEMFRSSDRKEHLEIFGFGMTRSMNIGDSRVNNFGSGSHETVDHFRNIGFVTGNWMRTHDDNIGVAKSEPTVFVRGHKRQC